MTIHTGFLSLILTQEERAGALGQPSEDCIGEVYCCLRQKEVHISCKFEQSFVCLDKLLARPLPRRFSNIVI
jgi:hypothetical protein